MAKATAQDVATDFPDAVRLARALRDVFGDGVKIVYARNAQGQEIGRRPTEQSHETPYTHSNVSALDSGI